MNMRRARLARPVVRELEGRRVPATFTVNAPMDLPDITPPGDGLAIAGFFGDGTPITTLRAALEEANSTVAADSILFSIKAGLAKTLTFAMPLPIIFNPVTIDATTEPGYAGSPVITLSGAGLIGPTDGLFIFAGSSTVRGLAIHGFGGSGIHITQLGSNLIHKNYIGTATDGVTGLANGGAGILVEGVGDNTIGGGAAADANLISGNFAAGVVLVSAKNTVAGNLIGTDKTGDSKLGNTGPGVIISNASDNTVGGAVGGGGPGTAPGNVISGNGGDGVLITGAGSKNNLVQGNLIGLAKTGDVALPNGIHGVEINGASSNTVGGSAAGTGNVISGNKGHGVLITGTGAQDNLVLGNRIGTDKAGATADDGAGGALGNMLNGVCVVDGPLNTIGLSGAGNLISGNTERGIRVLNKGAVSTLIQANLIGTDQSGTTCVDGKGKSLGNGKSGVLIENAPASIIGGSTTGDGNVISGNGSHGVEIRGADAKSTIVRGNFIGTDKAGSVTLDAGGNKLGNTGSGVLVSGATDTKIGGSLVGQGNVISGNGGDGININSDLLGAAAANNSVQGNFIGTDKVGTTKLGNTGYGVYVSDSTDNTIGGAAAGGVPGTAPGNVISANGKGGVAIVRVFSPDPANNAVLGNIIGLTSSGDTPMANGGDGVRISSGPNNKVGGFASGEGNLISGNTGNGVLIVGNDAKMNLVLGNLIGTDKTGTQTTDGAGNKLGNTLSGVQIEDAPFNDVGLSIKGAGNVISGNGQNGIRIVSSNAAGNTVRGNFIGTDKSGSTTTDAGGKSLGNLFHGVLIENALGNTIGGTTAAEGNVISGNTIGVRIVGVDSISNVVRANVIGTDKSGTKIADGNGKALGNASAGVVIENASMNTIGGSLSGQGNVISGNLGFGVHITGANKNLLLGNSIGTDSAGAAKLGNKLSGVVITLGSNNTIGGTAVNEPNTIAHNGADVGLKGHGVRIESGTGNALRRNSIHSNAGRGIDLNNDAVTFNDPGGDPDGGANNSQDYPVIIFRPQGKGDTGLYQWRLNTTPNKSFTIEFFANTEPDPSGFGEGREFLGDLVVVNAMIADKVTTDAQGNVTFLNVPFAGKTFISATATDEDGNTSEFSMVDTDADALADAWEMPVGPVFKGMNVNEDETMDLDLAALGANPNHKDLFVEVDAAVGFVPDAAIFNPATLAKDGGVINAFATAPDALVHNPDLADGITLHAALDDVTIPTTKYPNTWVDFDEVKNKTVLNGGKAGAFGTEDQRKNGNWTHIRNALKLVYRYCIFAEEYGPGISSGITEGKPLQGAVNDFLITIKPTDWVIAGHPAPDARDRAGTFMHELGHSLNIEHGGGDIDNYKPNYHSVMNYTWQIPNAVRRTIVPGVADFAASWILDYSRQAFDPLDENNLDEGVGIGGHAGHSVAYGSRVGGLYRGKLGAESGKIDFDRDGAIDVAITSKDINFDGKLTMLAGHEDWSVLKFYFLEAAEFADGVHGLGNPNELPTSPVPPTVESVTINGGAAQRSRVTEVTVTFDQPVVAGAGAFELKRQSDGKLVDVTATAVDDRTLTLTFTGALSQFDSLEDGRYTLRVVAGAVAGAGDVLDGNGDGVAGDDYVLMSSGTTGVFRLFGDADGDADTDVADFGAFRGAFGSTVNLAFDFDGDGDVDAQDFGQFRARFGSAI